MNKITILASAQSAARFVQLASLIGAFGTLASAAALTGVCGTGYTDNTCATLAGTTGASTDGNFTILAGSPGGSSIPFVTNSIVPSQTNWLADGIDASSWISPTGQENPGDSPGVYTYEEIFTIGAGFNPSSAQIAGAWATDDTGVIMLNGNLVGTASLAFGTLTPFTIDSSFTAGINKLDFEVTNGSISSQPVNPSGLRVEIVSTSISAAVPEPTSSAFLGLGLAALALVAMKNRRAMLK